MHITYGVKYFSQVVESHAQKIYQCGFKIVLTNSMTVFDLMLLL